LRRWWLGLVVSVSSVVAAESALRLGRLLAGGRYSEGVGRLSVVMRVKLVLALFLPALFLALPGSGHGALGLATALTAGIAVAFVVAVVLHGRLEAAVPSHVRAISLRERARLANFIRLRDPDAPGRTRSRAPSPDGAAA
jgi:hypothetical protein